MLKTIALTILVLGICVGICVGRGGRSKRDVSAAEAKQYVESSANWPEIQKAISAGANLGFSPNKFQYTSGAPSMPITIKGFNDKRTASCKIFLEKRTTGAIYTGNVNNCYETRSSRN